MIPLSPPPPPPPPPPSSLSPLSLTGEKDKIDICSSQNVLSYGTVLFCWAKRKGEGEKKKRRKKKKHGFLIIFFLCRKVAKKKSYFSHTFPHKAMEKGVSAFALRSPVSLPPEKGG
eukprot:TRINITY_DN5732_c0_g4_i1.p2 TRINITY_DN5732_c0_g4~~TRINITY_DN5732_c0_g4_i1.p2  ORF type:complete len:116 (+),score=9.10 TRINITY_DN5732_c0_g4_i1:325-672(+)